MGMPTLPFSHAPVRAAVASMLRSPYHAGNLYPVDEIPITLNIAVDVTDITAIDTMMLLRSDRGGGDATGPLSRKAGGGDSLVAR